MVADPQRVQHHATVHPYTPLSYCLSISCTASIVLGGTAKQSTPYTCTASLADTSAMLLPQVALEWCLLLQVSLLQVPWPTDLLGLPPFLPELDIQGRLLFKGPRIKMGICSGKPKTIIPDHLGRADYHGATINQAARCVRGWAIQLEPAAAAGP